MRHALPTIVALMMNGLLPLPLADVRVGQAAPQFRLPGVDGRDYALSDYQGKQPVVLVWFPALET